MLHLPDNLFACLRDTLSKEPSSATLEQHLPAIRDTILNLLQGLKKKQAQLRERLESSNSKLFSRAYQQEQCTLRGTSMPLPSPSSSTEPLARVQPHSVPQSPISPSTTTFTVNEEIDINDPSTKNALDALTLQENLARRSSVRRTSHNQTAPIETDLKDNQPTTLDLYLKMGDRVKKCTLFHQDVSFSGLYQLFRRVFALPIENPIINILDPISNIEYELESIQDVRPYSMLSIKGSMIPLKIMKPNRLKYLYLLGVDAPQPIDPGLKMLLEETMQQVLQKVTHQPHNIPQDKVMEQKKELESLRHDLQMVNRMYQDYKAQTTHIIGQLREKSHKVTDSKPTTVVILDEKAQAEMSESREVTQKAATMITNRLETLQDAIDQLKLDVTQKRCRPSKNQLKHCQHESQLVQVEMNDLQSLVKKFKPIWKKAWEVQLQQIVKEQQFLKEQEALLVDLKDDHKAVLEVMEQLIEISEIQERKKQLGTEFRPAPLEEGFEGMTSVMKQVSTIQVDHHQRIKAIDQAEKLRSKELSQRIDAFERELTNFVGLRKLKKIGGAEAIEKQRQEKDRALMKQIFVDSTVNTHDVTRNTLDKDDEKFLTPHASKESPSVHEEKGDNGSEKATDKPSFMSIIDQNGYENEG